MASVSSPYSVGLRIVRFHSPPPHRTLPPSFTVFPLHSLTCRSHFQNTTQRERQVDKKNILPFSFNTIENPRFRFTCERQNAEAENVRSLRFGLEGLCGKPPYLLLASLLITMRMLYSFYCWGFRLPGQALHNSVRLFCCAISYIDRCSYLFIILDFWVEKFHLGESESHLSRQQMAEPVISFLTFQWIFVTTEGARGGVFFFPVSFSLHCTSTTLPFEKIITIH